LHCIFGSHDCQGLISFPYIPGIAGIFMVADASPACINPFPRGNYHKKIPPLLS
jgi:hypothetical protein